MNLALNESKTQAKRLLKSLKSTEILPNEIAGMLKKLGVTSITQLQLKHCLALIAQRLGFASWHHAQELFSGKASIADQPDMGTLFYKGTCSTFLNLWFSDYQEAKQALTTNPENTWLVPYKKQFIVVKREYLTALQLTEENIALLNKVQHDLYHSYNTECWDRTACAVIRKQPLF
ncbi:hypothetical protein [Thalassotalea sp. G2M2-11]|uniref:hypothetical protein n=1 Tax=Thalassotalea sp. G2M2-11 TaxID=2787627 RepID=UPI0019CFB0DC|nr:hypothetical protein [Thalassotalea sp. G2M2-11]